MDHWYERPEALAERRKDLMREAQKYRLHKTASDGHSEPVAALFSQVNRWVKQVRPHTSQNQTPPLHTQRAKD